MFHDPSSCTSTELEIISISFASSPRRLERTARIRGSIPLPRCGRDSYQQPCRTKKLRLSPYLETTITGISWDLQYRKNSLKPESSLISVYDHPMLRKAKYKYKIKIKIKIKKDPLRFRQFVELCERREAYLLSLSAFLHSSNVCPFLLTLSNISRKASLCTANARTKTTCVSVPADGAALCTDHDTDGCSCYYVPERYTAGEDFQIARPPLFFPIPEKISHVCRRRRRLIDLNQMFSSKVDTRECSQSFES
jgi:hypothetical protein